MRLVRRERDDVAGHVLRLDRPRQSGRHGALLDPRGVRVPHESLHGAGERASEGVRHLGRIGDRLQHQVVDLGQSVQ